jgi:hypothetical protein
VYSGTPNGAVPEVPSAPRSGVPVGGGGAGGVSFDFEHPANKTNDARRNAFTHTP